MSEGEKKYEPTPRRREKARLEGRFAYSPDLVTAAAFAVGLAGTLTCAPAVGEFIKKLFLNSVQLSPDFAQTPTTEQVFQSASALMGQLLYVTAPFLASLLASTILAHFTQRRILFAPERDWPDAKNVNPVEGWNRLFNGRNISRQIVNLLKAALILLTVWLFFRNHFLTIIQLPQADFNAAALQTGALLKTILVRLALLLLIVGAADYFWQYRQFENSLWMTEQEMRDEQKDS